LGLGKAIILSAPVAIVLIVWGVPGMIEDVTTWQGWIVNVWDWLTLTPTPISWALVVIGIVILLRPQRLLHTRKKDINLGNQENTVDAAISVAEIIQDGIGEQYSSEVRNTLDKLIAQGETLVDKMQMPNFQVLTPENIEESVRQWLDNVERDIWKVIPGRAGDIVAKQGNLTPDEKLRYHGWSTDSASLRVLVDRRLSCLREIRSKIQTADLEIEHKDALQHVIIEGRDHTGLTVHEGRAGHPVMYPIKLRNSRPQVVDIVGWNVTILLDGEPIDNITWRLPSRDASNGLAIYPPFDSPSPLDALRIQPDRQYRLEIPVNMSKVSTFPPQSPAWTARGTVYFKCANENGEQQFNFDTDNYRLSDNQWGWYRTNRMLKD